MDKKFLHVIVYAAVALSSVVIAASCIRDNSYERSYDADEYEAAMAEDESEAEAKDPDKIYPEEVHFQGSDSKRFGYINAAYYELQKCDSIRQEQGDPDEINRHMQEYIRYATLSNELDEPVTIDEEDAVKSLNFYYNYVVSRLDEEYEGYDVPEDCTVSADD